MVPGKEVLSVQTIEPMNFVQVAEKVTDRLVPLVLPESQRPVLQDTWDLSPSRSPVGVKDKIFQCDLMGPTALLRVLPFGRARRRQVPDHPPIVALVFTGDLTGSKPQLWSDGSNPEPEVPLLLAQRAHRIYPARATRRYKTREQRGND